MVKILAESDIRSCDFNTDDTRRSTDTSTQVFGTRSENNDILTEEVTTQVKDNFVM